MSLQAERLADAPTLNAVRITDDRAGYLAVWCPWCAAWHKHKVGTGDEVRPARCDRRGGSPLLATGYILKCLQEIAAADLEKFAPRSIYPAAQFANSITQLSGNLRRAFIRATFRTRLVRREGFARLPGGRLFISGTGWTIEADGKPASGDDFLSLVQTVFGVSQGVAAVRFLEAATGVRFMPQVAVGIAAAIDDGALRT